MIGRIGASRMISKGAAKDPDSFTINHSLKKGSSTACHGYDIVSYWYGCPKKGDKKYECEYGSCTWRFYSRGNMKQFIDNPERFVPQFGGYCAYAMATKPERSYVDINPEIFCLVKGKLYLFFSEKVQQLWVRDMERYIDVASVRWLGKLRSPSRQNSLNINHSQRVHDRVSLERSLKGLRDSRIGEFALPE